MKTQHSHRRLLAGLIPLFLFGLSACNSTSVQTTWTAPDVSKISLKKVMVVATFPDSATRRSAEDDFKAQVTATQCVTSYSLLTSVDELKDVKKVSAAMKAAGVDGIIVMRPISDKDRVNYIPGSPYPEGYRTFGGYYNQNYALSPLYYDPGFITVDHIVKIETNIYEAAGERLIWSAETKSVNPGDLKQLITDAVSAIRAELVKEKLIPVPTQNISRNPPESRPNRSG
jgi:hypothetical protein